jgi:tetratricopeptide (TPR) repeat protein
MVNAFGSRLYRKIFSEEVARVWSEHKKASELSVVCIRIAPAANQLEAIPWETLFDGDEFLAAGVKTTISRLPLDIQPLSAPPPVPAPLRMLALFSSPLDLQEQSRLQMEHEQEILLEAINDPAGQGRLRADFEDEAKLEILESSLEAPYQILHFSGHGMSAESGGGLLLEDVRGNSRPTSVPEVMQSLQRGEKSLRLVVLSGCQTARTLEIGGLRDMARGLLRRGIPSVVAMQFSISDVGGLKFAQVFYSRIATGQSLEMAIHAARRALMLSDESYLKADALASVLLAASGDCLQTTHETPGPIVVEPKLDTAFFLPLAQLSHGFYGRRSEYRQVRDAILHRNQRAVIIHGIGGIGKTALVSHVATRQRQHFQGVYAFDCSSGTLAPETVMLELHRYFEAQGVNALARLLFRNFEPEMLANYLGQLLSQWSLLLIFDNFETQLVRDGDGFRIADESLRTFITTLVKTTATKSHFLFTSRYWFDLDERRLGTIESLHLQDLSRPEALSLMQKLPRLGKASYEEKLEALDAFGGHPYALITLDRHCQHRSLEQALTDAKEIHGELRKFLAIEINYARLSERGRQLLNGLAAFRKSVPYDAAEWVLGVKVEIPSEILKNLKSNNPQFADLDDASFAAIVESKFPEQRVAVDVNGPMRELIEWGLLTPVHENDEVAGLSTHALVREFCRDKQTNESWTERVRDAAGYYTNSTKLIEREERSPDSVWAEMEAFELLLEIERYQDAAGLLVGAHELLDRWGFVHYLDSQHRRLLDVLDPEGTAVLLHNFGYLLQSRGDYGQALECYERSLKIGEELGNRAGVASSLHQVGRIQELRGDYERAWEYYERALRINEELGNREGVAASLHQVGMIQQLRGDYEQALEYYERSLEIKEELGNRAGVASSLHQVGMIQQDRGEYEQALEYYERSLKILEELGNRAGVASSLHQVGMIHQDRGEYEQALEYYERSLKINEELGNRAGVANSLHQVGMIQQLRGDYEQALEYYDRSLKIAEELGDRAGVAISLHQVGMIQQDRSDYEQALEYYERSLKILEELANRAGVAISQGQIGKLFTETGRYAEALDHLLVALSTFLELQSPNASIVIDNLRTLRGKWGEDNFDTAWKNAIETDVPDWLKSGSEETDGGENQSQV